MSHRNAATEVSAGGILPIAASWSPSPARWRSPALPRQQLARIDAPIGTVVVQAKGMDSLRAALDRAKILPTWTPRNIAVAFLGKGSQSLRTSDGNSCSENWPLPTSKACKEKFPMVALVHWPRSWSRYKWVRDRRYSRSSTETYARIRSAGDNSRSGSAGPGRVGRARGSAE
jgi:hypothetical protein